LVNLLRLKYARLGVRDLRSVVEEVSKPVLEELEHLLSTYGVGRARYVEVLKIVFTLGKARWSEIKRGIEVKLGKEPNNALMNILRNLQDVGVLRKDSEGYYGITGPIINYAIKYYLRT